MTDYRCPLEKGTFYHIYNRGNAGTRLFYKKENYEFFLHRYSEYLSPFVDTFALCLLPNHFHLLVQVKEEAATVDLPGFKNLAGLASRPRKTSQVAKTREVWRPLQR